MGLESSLAPRHMAKTALEFCQHLPEAAKLPTEAGVALIRAALSQDNVDDFPVLDGQKCIGFTTRKRLQAALNVLERNCSLAVDTESLIAESVVRSPPQEPLLAEAPDMVPLHRLI